MVKMWIPGRCVAGVVQNVRIMDDAWVSGRYGVGGRKIFRPYRYAGAVNRMGRPVVSAAHFMHIATNARIAGDMVVSVFLPLWRPGLDRICRDAS